MSTGRSNESSTQETELDGLVTNYVLRRTWSVSILLVITPSAITSPSVVSMTGTRSVYFSSNARLRSTSTTSILPLPNTAAAIARPSSHRGHACLVYTTTVINSQSRRESTRSEFDHESKQDEAKEDGDGDGGHRAHEVTPLSEVRCDYRRPVCPERLCLRQQTRSPRLLFLP